MQERSRHHIIFWSFFILIAGLYLYLRLNGEVLIGRLFESQDLSLLNKITGVSDDRSLNFYLGKVENVLLGPTKSLLSGLLLFGFWLMYLRKGTVLQISASVLIYLLITRFETLFYPPYGESITGPFSDAVWLIQNNLNYFELLKQDTYAQAGPQIYPMSLYPLFLAVLMKISPSVPFFLVTIHLLTFLMASFCVGLLYKIHRMYFDELPALTMTFLFVALPVFQSMVELINMEVPQVFFALLSANYLIQKRMAAASFCAIAAMLVKVSGFISCAAVFAMAIIYFLVDTYTHQSLEKKRKWINLFWGFFALAVGITIGIIRAKIIGEQSSNNKISFLGGWIGVRVVPWFWVFLIASVFFVFDFASRLRTRQKNINSFWMMVYDWRVPIIMFLISGLWFLMYLNFSAIAFRYQLILGAFFIFGVSYLIILLFRPRIVSQIFLTALCLFSLFCSHGWIYVVNHVEGVNPTQLERSLEYRNFLKMDMIAAKDLTENFSTWVIAAPFGSAQELSLPVLGYVQKPLDVRIYGMRATLEVKPFTGLKDLDLNNTVFIGFEYDKILPDIPFPFDPNRDQLIKKIVYGDCETLLFRGGFAIEHMRLLIKIMQVGLLDELTSGRLSFDQIKALLKE